VRGALPSHCARAPAHGIAMIFGVRVSTIVMQTIGIEPKAGPESTIRVRLRSAFVVR